MHNEILTYEYLEKDDKDIEVVKNKIKQSKEQTCDYGSKKVLRQKLTPEMCYDILKKISDDDLTIMGFGPTKSRPEHMIHGTHPISPPSLTKENDDILMQEDGKQIYVIHIDL